MPDEPMAPPQGAPHTLPEPVERDDGRVRVDVLFRHGGFANLGGLLVAAVSAVVLWPVADPGHLIAWLGASALLFGARALLVHSYRHAAGIADPGAWLNVMTLGAALSGGLWAALGMLLRPDWPLAYQAYIFFVLAGLSAGAIASYSSNLRVYCAFVFPMLLPNAVALAMSGGEAGIGMGLALLVYCAALFHIVRESNANFRGVLHLRDANASLLRELTGANASLRASAEVRERMLQELRDSERKFRDLVEGSIQGILIHSDWRPLFVNRPFAELLGFTSTEEVLALDSLEQMFSLCDLRRLHSLPPAAARGDSDTLVKYEAEAMRKDGSRVILQCAVRSIIWGERPAIQISVVDITDLAQTTKALQAVEQTYQQVFSTITDATLLFDADSLAIVDANPAALSLYGYGWEQMLRASVLDLGHDEDAVRRTVERALARNQSSLVTGTHRNRSGRTFPVEISASAFELQDRATICAVVRDVTDRQHAEDALRESEERFRDFAETAADFFWETNAEQRYTYVSERYAEVAGLSPEQLLGLDRDMFNTGTTGELQRWTDHRNRIGNFQPFMDLEVSFVRPEDGNIMVLRNSARPKFDENDNFTGYRGVVRNVTEAHNLSRQLSYQASHDGLTGLVNRAEFEIRLQESLEHLRVTPSTHALCYLDLDQFKVINDTCGHAAGDELLRQVSSELASRVRRADTIARLGGDEFAVLMEDCSIEKATEVADTLRHAIEEFQFLWDNKKFNIGVSIGLVPIEDAHERFEDILRAADSACYAAKDMGRNRVHVYHPADEELARREGEMQWVTRITQAIEEDRFDLSFQCIAPANRNPQGAHYELLLRLRDEHGTLIPTGAFLPAAERYNMITRLDRWVVATAIDWLVAHPAHLRDLYLCSINLSGQTLSNEDFRGFVVDKLRSTGFDGSKLCFEITETAAIAHLATATRFIHDMRKLGCRFALDDFGSGLSSFAYLKNLPVDFLKIDGVFVRDIVDDPIDFAMVKSINEIGKVMGKQTIAEFVENRAVARKLQRIGIDYLQGQFIGAPRPLAELANMPTGTRPAVTTGQVAAVGTGQIPAIGTAPVPIIGTGEFPAAD